MQLKTFQPYNHKRAKKSGGTTPFWPKSVFMSKTYIQKRIYNLNSLIDKKNYAMQFSLHK